MGESTARFGTCAVCERVYRLTGAGRVWRHGHGYAWCRGWGKPPAEWVDVDPRELCLDCRANFPHAARGLCPTCYNRNHANDTLDLWPAANRDPGDVPTEPTYRQLDYWIRQGWLHPDNPAPGPGTVRFWPPAERRVAAMMARLAAAGVTPKVAHDIARAGGRLEIAPGVVVEVRGG